MIIDFLFREFDNKGDIMTKILIADDNKQITSILKEYANKEGYETLVAADGEQAIALFESGNPDLLLLDVMMPKLDGFQVCRHIRGKSNVPIIMVTARGEDFEKIMGLDIGADDYIIKPFSPGEVMARVRAILRRVEPSGGLGNNVLTFGSLEIDSDTFTAQVGQKPVLLTKKEFELLRFLAENQGKVFSRDKLLDALWGYEYYGDGRTVDSHIKRLRAKLDAVPHEGWDIKTIWGVGYKFEIS